MPSRRLYEDYEFELTETDHRGGYIEWKRPKEIYKNPILVDNYDFDDIEQGNLGDCWFLASIGALAEHDDDKAIFGKIIPPVDGRPQGFGERGSYYTGKFVFQFFHYGKQVQVVIDDRLPTRHGKLIYVQDKYEPGEGRSKEGDELWAALLEKAFAKYFGGYKNIIAGNAVEALRVLVDTVAVSMKLKDHTREQVIKALEHGEIITASIDRMVARRGVNLNGLKDGHCYTVLGHARLINSDDVLVQIYNPHGKNEWQGDWSDGSWKWDSVAHRDRRLIPEKEDDGMFWMEIDDFMRIYADMDVAFSRNQWHEIKTFHEEWSRGLGTAGGYSSRRGNPACVFRKKTDNDLIINLLQKDTRKSGATDHFLGFRIYDSNDRQVYATAAYKNGFNGGQVSGLASGTYTVTPTTYSAGEEAAFALRVFEEREQYIGDGSGLAGAGTRNPQTLGRGKAGTKYRSVGRMMLKSQQLALDHKRKRIDDMNNANRHSFSEDFYVNVDLEEKVNQLSLDDILSL